MHLISPSFAIEVRPDGVKLQFVGEGGPVQVTLTPDEFYRFRYETNVVANQMVRDADRPLWADRAAAYKAPRSPWGKK